MRGLGEDSCRGSGTGGQHRTEGLNGHGSLLRIVQHSN